MNFFTKNPNLTKKEKKLGEGGGVDGQTDKQAQTNFPLQLLTMNKRTSYGPDKLN